MVLWRLFEQLEKGDSAHMDYVAQAILRGQTPYRDVVEIKGPLSAYLSALAMWIGKSAGMRDVIAVRFMQIMLVAVLCAVTFLIVEILSAQPDGRLDSRLFPADVLSLRELGGRRNAAKANDDPVGWSRC